MQRVFNSGKCLHLFSPRWIEKYNTSQCTNTTHRNSASTNTNDDADDLPELVSSSDSDDADDDADVKTQNPTAC